MVYMHGGEFHLGKPPAFTPWKSQTGVTVVGQDFPTLISELETAQLAGAVRMPLVQPKQVFQPVALLPLGATLIWMGNTYMCKIIWRMSLPYVKLKCLENYWIRTIIFSHEHWQDQNTEISVKPRKGEHTKLKTNKRFVKMYLFLNLTLHRGPLWHPNSIMHYSS